jgi:signal transduction histidine kinase
MMAGVVLLAVTAVVGVRGLHQDFGVALRANEQTRRIYTVGAHVAAAKSFLEHQMQGSAQAELREAVGFFDLFDQSSGFSWVAGTQGDAQKVREAIEKAIGEIGPGSDGSVLNGAYGSLTNFSTATRRAIDEVQRAADERHRVVLGVVILLSGVITGLAGWMGLRLYRGVVLPLEKRIEEKSRELVQSERLASVGYLAAGVAHEINNPLGIIAGYGERALQKLSRDQGGETVEYVKKAVGVMCEESFRCKEITDRLLMLARPGESARRVILLGDLAREVIGVVSALPRFAGRKVVLEGEEGCAVVGNEGEIRQVILNLVVNALEASDGEVRVTVGREEADVVLCVEDEGQGMTAETMGRVFEPFFTMKRGERPGTGLGLSVAHAIVKDHKGRIEAYSEGVDRGSRFVVRMQEVS